MALENLSSWNSEDSKVGTACGTACGAGDKPEEEPVKDEDKKPAACGTACGAGTDKK